jgi:hypothetical protein
MASTIFNYSGVKDTVNFSAGLPGQRGRISPLDLIVTAIVKSGKTLENGMACKITFNSTSKVYEAEPIAANDSVDVFDGFVIQDITAQKSDYTVGGPQFIYSYVGVPVSVLRNGYVWIPVQNATPTITSGGAVYMRTVADATITNLPIGGIESADDSTDTSILAKVLFTGQYGFPLQGTNNGTTVASGLTGRTALLMVNLGNIA